MAINPSDAFEVTDDGVAFNDQDGNQSLYLTTGTADPTGSVAPINTWYVRNSGSAQLLYYKFGAGNSDWRQIRADDIAFDVTGLTGNSPDLTGLTQAKEVIDALSNRNFGKHYSSGGNDLNTTSTGTVVEAASTVAMSVGASGTVTMKGQWSFRMVNSKSNTDGQVQVLWRSTEQPGGLALDQQSSSGTTYSGLGAGLGEQTVGFGEFSFTGPQNNIELYATILRTGGNGAARVNSVRMELWRI